MLESDLLPTKLPRKRSHEEVEAQVPSDVSDRKSEDTHLPTPESPCALNGSVEPPPRQASVLAPSESSALSKTRTPTPSGATQVTHMPSTEDDKALKKRKLTFAEKEVERAIKASERETARRKRTEESSIKEQERLARDEEKRRKAEEKEHAQKQREIEKAEREKAREAEKHAKETAKRKRELDKESKEAEKQAKEDAKRKEEEDKKNKLEKSQLRLAAFLGAAKGADVLKGPVRSSSRRSSVGSLNNVDGPEDHLQSRNSPVKKMQGKDTFLPFFVLQHVQLAPVNRFAKDRSFADTATMRIDRCLQEESSTDIAEAMSTFKSRKRKCRQRQRCSLKEVVDRMQNTSANPIDLTSPSTNVSQVSDFPYKILSFAEDVRPPYKGTYTRVVPLGSARKLSRRPFNRQLPDTDYDYDSEAEWEPPNEGDEDLESGDDESDAGDEGDEDMDGFLDNEEDAVRRKLVVGGGDLTPISSGLCWASADDEKGPLEEYRMQPLSDQYAFPIDPFSTTYWPKAPHQPMQPPALRPPLSGLVPHRNPSTTTSHTTQELGQLNSQMPPSRTHQALGAAYSSPKTLRSIPDDVLPAFKSAVQGSELTKAGLVEVLKKQFPRLSKDTIKHTLAQVAVRQGVREAEKKWVLANSVESVGGRHWTWRAEGGGGVGTGTSIGVGVIGGEEV